jgi:hypothetical protein
MEITPTSWQPMAQQAQNTLPTRPNHPFYYKWHPTNWQFVYRDIETVTGKGEKAKTVTQRKGFFIPHLRMERVIPGVNGIHQIQGELGNPGSRIGSLQQQGWVYLDPQKYDYMHVYPVRGGRYHVPKFMNIKVVAGRVIEKMDTAAFHTWSVNMLRSNILGTPETHFWELMVIDKQKNKQADSLMKMQHIPEKKAQLDELRDTIKDMKAFIAEYETVGMAIFEDFTK